MWNASDTKWIFRAGLLALALALCSPSTGPALAQPPGAAATPAAETDRQELRQALERSYEVLPLHNGVMLRPREERVGVRTIEVSGSTIAVNGERVTEGVLRAWIGQEEAAPILRLYGLPPRERQALFGLQPGSNGEAEREVTAETPDGETEIPAEGELPAETPEPPQVPSPPPAPETPDADEYPSTTTGSRLKFFGNIVIEKDELAEEAVALAGSVRVEGEVDRDVTAVGGSVTINGRVGGSVTAVGGNVRLGPNAVVEGDVTSAGGTIIRAEGSRIGGQTSEAGMDHDRDWDRDVDFGFPWSPFRSTRDLIWQLAGVGILALLVCLCLLVARGPLDRVERHVATEPWVAGLVGFLAQLLFLPLLVTVTVLLVITIVGCALIALYPFLFIALGLAALLGYAAVAHRLGRFLETRFNRSFGSSYAVALVGVLAIEAWSLVGHLMGLGGGVMELIALPLLALGFAAQYVAWTVGFGAVLLARFGSSRGTTYYPPAVTPPPPPPPPPVPYDPVLEGPDDRPAGV